MIFFFLIHLNFVIFKTENTFKLRIVRNILLEGNRQKPTIFFDGENGILEMKGRSLPEQAHDLYKPLLDWIDEYQENPQPTTTFNIHLEYINSSSNKYLLLILKKLDDFAIKGHDVIINWYCEEDDEDLLDTVEEYRIALSTPINLHTIHSDNEDEEDF